MNNLETTEQKHWQRQNENTDNRTSERPGDTVGSYAVEEEEQIQSDISKKERRDNEDHWKIWSEL